MEASNTRIAEIDAEIALLKQEASKSHGDGHKPAYLREIRRLRLLKAAVMRHAA